MDNEFINLVTLLTFWGEQITFSYFTLQFYFFSGQMISMSQKQILNSETQFLLYFLPSHDLNVLWIQDFHLKNLTQHLFQQFQSEI